MQKSQGTKLELVSMQFSLGKRVTDVNDESQRDVPSPHCSHCNSPHTELVSHQTDVAPTWNVSLEAGAKRRPI